MNIRPLNRKQIAAHATAIAALCLAAIPAHSRVQVTKECLELSGQLNAARQEVRDLNASFPVPPDGTAGYGTRKLGAAVRALSDRYDQQCPYQISTSPAAPMPALPKALPEKPAETSSFVFEQPAALEKPAGSTKTETKPSGDEQAKEHGQAPQHDASTTAQSLQNQVGHEPTTAELLNPLVQGAIFDLKTTWWLLPILALLLGLKLGLARWQKRSQGR